MFVVERMIFTSIFITYVRNLSNTYLDYIMTLTKLSDLFLLLNRVKSWTGDKNMA